MPDRLAGWWLASVFGTLAVLVLARGRRATVSRASAAKLAAALADQLDGGLVRKCTKADSEAAMAAKMP